MNRASLSVIIICKNEERVITETLESVKGWADEIIVLDSGSTDKTVEIAKQYTDDVHVTDWPGYGKQKNRALDKATCDWVLSIDADEAVTEELKEEITRVINSENCADGYKVRFKLLYFGKYIRSVVKRNSLILFRRNSGRFTEPAVHEAVKVDGRVSRIRKGRILHNSYESLSHQINKLNGYAELWAMGKHERGKQASLRSAFSHSAFTIIKNIFFNFSFLDGWRGFLLSIILAQYTFNKYAILKSMRFEEYGDG